MFDRDELARAVMLQIEKQPDRSPISPNGIAIFAYQTADAMNVESAKANNLFVRFRIGAAQKQPKDAPAPSGITTTITAEEYPQWHSF